MKKRLFTAIFSSCLLLNGCSSLNPTLETLSSTEVPITLESTVAPVTTEIPTTEAPTTMEDTSPIAIDITTVAPETTTSSSGHMEENSVTYSKNNIHINYPILLGMSDIETQDWANDEIYADIMALLKYYGVDEEKDTFTLDYQVSTIYRSEFSLVYEGEFKKASTGNTIKVRASEDLDLTTKTHIRLANRLTAQKIRKSILGEGDTKPDYEIVLCNVSEDVIRTYLSQQDEKFFANLVAGADFGDSKLTGVFSYSYLNSNIAIVIPVPHVMGDFAVVSIKQKTK